MYVAIPYKSGKYSNVSTTSLEDGSFEGIVAIPYKSGKYSNLNDRGFVDQYGNFLSQSLINQGNILTLMIGDS